MFSFIAGLFNEEKISRSDQMVYNIGGDMPKSIATFRKAAGNGETYLFAKILKRGLL